MRVSLGSGWKITHLTDRVVQLTKDDPVYRRLTGRDGTVLVRGEPGMSRTDLITSAQKHAVKQDEHLSMLVTRDVLPKGKALIAYRDKLRQLRPAFAVSGEEPAERVYRP